MLYNCRAASLFYCRVVYCSYYESVIYGFTAVLSSAVVIYLLSTVLLQCCLLQVLCIWYKTVLLQCCLPLLLWICYLLFYSSVVFCFYASIILLFYCSAVYHCCYESVIYCSTSVLYTIAVMNLLYMFYFSVVYRCCYESVIYCSTSVLSTVAVMNLLYSVLLQCCLLLLSTVLLLLVLWIFYVFGVFAKNERGYSLTAKNTRFWSLLILLLSVASIRRKLLKSTYTEEHSVHTNSESCNIWLVL